MGTPEGPNRYEGLPLPQDPGDAVYLCCLYRLLDTHPWQEGWETAGKHGLPRSWRAYHHHVVPPGGGYLHCTLDVLLPLDLVEVEVILTNIPEILIRIDGAGGDGGRPIEEFYQLGKILHPYYNNPLNEGRLPLILLRDDDALNSPLPCRCRHGEGAPDRLHPPVEREFTGDEKIIAPVAIDKPLRREDGNRHG